MSAKKVLHAEHQTIMNTRLRQRSVMLVILGILVQICVGNPARAIEGGELAYGENVSALIYLDAASKPFQSNCTAEVIAPRLAVTAKHCLTSTSPLYWDTGFRGIKFPLRVAEPGVDVKASQKSSVVLKVVTTPGDWQSYEDDLSILILESEVAIPTTFKIATTEDLARLSQSGATVVTYGYGTNSKGEIDGRPKKFRSRLLKVENNSKAFKAVVPSATYRHCSGDSGGPSYAIENGVMYYLGPSSASSAPSCQTNEYNSNNSYYYGGNLLGHFPELLAEAEGELASIIQKEFANRAAERAKEAPSGPEAVPAPTKSIVCRRGYSRRIVTAVKPKCPQGFRLVRRI